ncbi:MAG: hypothetical protein ACRDZX_13140 [Acidimicrobiales bacterium]
MPEALDGFGIDGAGALFCSCSNLRAYEALPALRLSTGAHVVTSNQAVVESLRRRAGGPAGRYGSVVLPLS